MKKTILMIMLMFLIGCSTEFNGQNKDLVRNDLPKDKHESYNEDFDFLLRFYTAKFFYDKGMIDKDEGIYMGSSNFIIFDTIPKSAEEKYINEIGEFTDDGIRGMNGEEIMAKAKYIRGYIHTSAPFDNKKQNEAFLKLFKEEDEK